jgi:hypothetical protein
MVDSTMWVVAIGVTATGILFFSILIRIVITFA